MSDMTTQNREDRALVHHTVLSGHERLSPRSEVADAVIAACRRLCQPGTHAVPGFRGYTLRATPEGGSLLVTVSKGIRPLVTFGVATRPEEADQLWAALKRLHRVITDSPPAPPPSALPWVSAALAFATPAEAFWVADLERCVAWAWLAVLEETQAEEPRAEG